MGEEHAQDDIPDLWPEDLVLAPGVSPKTIMDRQAALLTARTGGKLEGTVITRVLGRDFAHTLYITAPTLGGYRCFLLRIRHSVDALYPLRISTVEREDGGDDVCEDLRSFVAALQAVINDTQTRERVSVLLSQC